MSTSKSLTARADVDNSDIPEIIEKAERLRQQALSDRERESHRSSVQDVKQVGRDLSIPDRFIEQAIAEMRDARRAETIAAQNEMEERQAVHTEVRYGLSKLIRLVGGVVAGILLLRSAQWLWFALDFTPSEISISEPKVVIEERVIDGRKEQTVNTVAEEPVKTRSILEQTTSITDAVPKAKSETVSSVGAVSLSSSATYLNKKSTAVVTEVPVDNRDSYKQDAKEAVPAPTDGFEKSLPHLTRLVEGEWVLDAYMLYEKGVELPMEVPVVYEPLELPKTWRFTSGKYKRVMDTNLSFTARFEVSSLPDSLRPVVDESGEWGQLVASNVVSTIPGIRRQNDYFAVLVAKDTLTIWYLGPNAYRKKLPSQAERYVRK